MFKPRLHASTPWFIVIRADSDSRRAHKEVASVLRASGREHHFLPVSDPKHLEATCRRAAHFALQKQGAIVAVGDDGLLNEATNAALPTGLPFGSIALGASACARRVAEISLDPARAAAALLTGHVSPQQVAWINDRGFTSSAGVGLHPELLEDGDRQVVCGKRESSDSALAALLRSTQRFVLNLRHGDDDEQVSTPTLLVTNRPTSSLGTDDVDATQRHQLSAAFVRPVSTAQLWWLTLNRELHRLGEDSRVRGFAFRRLSVQPRASTRAIPVLVDGELRWFKPPLVFSTSAFPLMAIAVSRGLSAAAA